MEPSPALLSLAGEIEADIRRRRLKPGDAYLSTLEVATQFAVSGTLANRALQLVAKRRLLIRKQRSGSVVGDPRASGAAALQRVHLLVPERYLQTEGLLTDGVLVGLQAALPQAQLQFTFISSATERQQVDALIAESLRAHEPHGFVLVRMPFAIQQACDASGLPAVVFGMPYTALTRLASLERDQALAARLIAEALLAHKHRQFAVLMREQLFPGDHVFMDALQQRLVAAGAAPATLRCLPPETQEIAATVRALQSTSKCTAFVCRSLPLAEAAARVLGERQASTAVALADVYGKRGDSCVWPYIQARWTPEEMGARLGARLSAQAAAPHAAGGREIIPVELVSAPPSARSGRSRSEKGERA